MFQIPFAELGYFVVGDCDSAFLGCGQMGESDHRHVFEPDASGGLKARMGQR
jgi:hypothetical protein